VLHADLWRGNRPRPAAFARTPMALESVDVGRRRDRFPALPAEPAVERATPFSVFGTAGEHPPQRARCAAEPGVLPDAGASGDDPVQLSAVGSRAVVLLPGKRPAVPGAGLDMGVHGPRHHHLEPARLLSVSIVSDTVRCRLRSMALAIAMVAGSDDR